MQPNALPTGTDHITDCHDPAAITDIMNAAGDVLLNHVAHKCAVFFLLVKARLGRSKITRQMMTVTIKRRAQFPS